MTKLTALFLISLTLSPILSSDPVPFTINTKKWSHVLDDHFISITVNPTDILQGKVYGLAMNSTLAILKGLAPAYVRIGSADTAKYTFKKNRYPSDMVKSEDEYIVTETHWMVFNEVAQSAGLDVIVCLNAAHKIEGTKKWDTRNSLELISFSDSQGYNLTWQLGYEVQSADDISGLQFGKDLNRLRTILNAFPRYQNSKLIGPDIRIIHKKEDIDFWNDVLIEAGPTLDAVTWHPRWPQPSKMKVSDNSDLGYEFPHDYLEYDKVQLNKILQKSVFKNPVWIGETKTESTGTFAEGLIWARRLVLAAKSGIEVVMKQPNLMDVSHPKPEYWIALLHKRLLGKSVLETRSVTNNTDLAVISHCTNPMFWSDKPEKLQDGAVTIYGVNMGGIEQKIQIKGTWTGKSQLMFQYVLTSGSDPDSVFSQMTYLNGEPLMMSDDGSLPDIVPRIKKMNKGLTMKLPPYSIGYWVIPEARVKICQIQPHSMPTIHIETAPSAVKSAPKNLQDIQDINQFLVEKLKNPESESVESTEMKIEEPSSESLENVKDLSLLSKENDLPRVARRIRQIKPIDELNKELKTIIQETEEFLMKPELVQSISSKMKLQKPSPNVEHRIHKIAEGISDAIKTTNQEYEFNKFLEDSGLKKDFGSLLITDRMNNAPGMRPMVNLPTFDVREVNQRMKRSISASEENSREESIEVEKDDWNEKKFAKKISLLKDHENDSKKKQDLLIPDIKELEEKYKFVVKSTIEDGKRKIDGIKKNIKLNEKEMPQKIMPPVPNHEIQEEILKKEIELLEKTEETVADILENQKKQQEAFKGIIFDELSEVKDERISALREMYKNQRKNSIMKRQEQTALNKPLLKTVEYIEKNFNLEPESVRKIKRSLEEKMGELLNNFDKRKNMEIKKRMVQPRDEKKMTFKRRAKDSSMNSDEEIERRRIHDDHPRSFIRKTSTTNKLHHNSKPLRKPEIMMKKSNRKMPNSEEFNMYDEDDSFELFNKKKLEDLVKPERRRLSMESQKQAKKESRNSRKEELMGKSDPDLKKSRERGMYESFESEEMKEVKGKKEMKLEKEVKEKKEMKEEKEMKEKKEMSEKKEVKEEKKPEPPVPEMLPLKNDKERRENMLKQITSLVDSMELKEERLKKMKDDDGISEEFETDGFTRKFKRKPREAEIRSIFRDTLETRDIEKIGMVSPELTPKSSAKEPSTSPLSKIRKKIDRTRPRGKPVVIIKRSEEPEDASLSSQQKRHSERPLLDKKILSKIKTKKVNPKLFKSASEVPVETNKAEEPEITEKEAPKMIEQEAVTPMPVTESTDNVKEERKDNNEEIIGVQPQEMQTEGTNSENVEKKEEDLVERKNEEDLVEGQKVETDFSGETPTPTEGYIVVEPTTEEGMEEKIVAETAKMDLEENPTTDSDLLEEKRNIPELESESNDSDYSLTQNSRSDYEAEPNLESRESEYNSDEKENKEEKKFVQLENVENVMPDTENVEQKMPEMENPLPQSEDVLVASEPKSEKEDEETQVAITLPVAQSEPVQPKETTSEKNQRKRRATFLTHRPSSEDHDEEEDNSSEERIAKFKQMIYKKSPAKRTEKNEVRSSGGMGMGADELLRMAGSTVRVMFDDVIPEAYGQTKSKIQNMGIPEYIKEFGKIVQQMKNLDQIFLNIGEAAVKGYIKGNKEEKGPHIQVISRKKRSAKADDLVTDISTTSIEEPSTIEEMHETDSSMWEASPKLNEEQTMTQTSEERDMTTGNDQVAEYARTSTPPTITTDKPGSDWKFGSHGSEPGESIHPSTGGGIPSVANAGEGVEKEEKEVPQETLSIVPNFSELELISKPIKELHKQIPKLAKRIQPYIESTGKEIATADSAVSDDLSSQISPWIKTTKDFIRQAFTTLQRQKELSEILASDLMSKEEALRKAIEKREAKKIDPKSQVYHAVPSATHRKRDTHIKYSDELVRQLRGLQPGVYVVPTEDMTNVRSEQITNEAKAKSGLPNVVTLNIYYDKKNADAAAKADAASQTVEPTLTQDMVNYYQNRVWNTVTGQYDQNNQYVSPMVVPDVNLPNPLASQLQVTPGVQYPTPDISNSRLIQYPTTNINHPAVSRYPSAVPNTQPVYNSAYFLPPDTRFIPQPPGTRRQWREFRARSSGVPVPMNAINNGWNIQYETVPGSIRSTLKPLTGSSYNKHFKLFADKKRSIGDPKVDNIGSEAAVPVWKFFPSTSDEKIYNRLEEKESEEKQTSGSFEEQSTEDLIEKFKKRIKQKKKKVKEESAEEEPEDVKGEREEEQNEKSRKRRSVGENSQNELQETKKLSKRSYPYRVEFKDHDILPEWFGTYQEIDNSLGQLPTHVRRSHIISTPWSDEDEELLAILGADDALPIIDLDNDDYYYANDNSIGQLRRYSRSRRSTDQSENNMIKSNMIYKSPKDTDDSKPKVKGVKKISDEDSSLEMMTKVESKTASPMAVGKTEDDKTATPLPKMTQIKVEQTQSQEQPQYPSEFQIQLQKYAQPLLLQQQQLQERQLKPLLEGQLPLNDTMMLPRNPNDDSLYYFFKYAYDSLVKVMKNMAQLF